MNVMFFSSIAISTKESLEQQKKSLTGITQKVNALASILYTKITQYYLGRNARKPVFGVSDKVSFKQVSSARKTS